MMSDIGTPSACERSLTDAPDGDGDRPGGRSCRRLRLTGMPRASRALARVGTRPAGGRVDDDAALAAAPASAPVWGEAGGSVDFLRCRQPLASV